MSGKTPSKKSILARRLRHARLKGAFAQDRLGVLAGLEEASASARMSRYESGIHEPSFQFVEAIARVLSISAAYFYCEDDKLAEIIRIYSNLSEEKRTLLHRSAVNIVE